jgi:cellulose synthase/poly-beta-1,6-N-acetylglucosamine synthase-like glycosyltransferase
MSSLGAFLYAVFMIVALIMTLYSLNFCYLCYQSQHNVPRPRGRAKSSEYVTQQNLYRGGADLPTVTIQLPIYNEKYVARRLIEAVCLMDYPREKLEIQVLDDSDDDTIEVLESVIKEHRLSGTDISHLHKSHRRVGYKAGALKAGTSHAKGEFIAIFDADFVPPSSFLNRTIGYFVDPEIGFIQCRWGHINENYSSLTEAQAFSLDLHFMIEQKAKSLTHLFMNFNGTAGIWRTSCIIDAGGWHTATLVEDLDLSYRAQMKGWKCLFLEDVVVDAELPVQMNAAKRQQFRWAKGSIQVALKLLTDILSQEKLGVDTKIQAFTQLTRHVIHPLFLVQYLVFPILLALNYKLYSVGWAPIIAIMIYILLGPATYVYMIRKIWGNKWREKIRQYIFMIFFATGMSVNNSVAVIDALFRGKNEFLRTPKFGVIKKDDEWREKEYVLPFTKITLLEIFFALYGFFAIFVSIFSSKPLFVPILAIQTIGFAYTAYLSLTHSFLKNRADRKHGVSYSGGIPITKIAPAITTLDNRLNSIVDANPSVWTSLDVSGGRKKMRTTYRKLVMPVVVGYLCLGCVLAYFGYQNTIYPIDKAIGYLSRAESAQTADAMAGYLRSVKQLLPTQGNPVWTFPSPKTDFGLIHNDIDAMLYRATSLSSFEPNNVSYSTALEDMRASVKIVESNLEDATPYIYASFTNILLAGLWIGVMLLMFAALRRTRARLNEYEAR